MMKIRESKVDSLPFDKHAVDVLGRLRAAFANAIADMPGNISRATDLQRIAGIDMNLSWRLFKVAHASSPLAAAPHVPGAAYIRNFLKAASRVGVRNELLKAIESAVVEFDRLVRIHAGDRNTFNSMLSALLGNDDAGQFNLQQRRAAFRANRHLFGLQATTQLRCGFMEVGDDPSRVSLALLDGYVNLRQLRRNVPLTISRAMITDDADTPFAVPARSISPQDNGEIGLALIPQFCSQPPPQLRRVRSTGGYLTGELTNPDVGNKGAITCVTGWWAQDVVPRYRSPDDLHASVMSMVRVPSESLLFCLLVREDLWANLEPKSTVYSDHRAELPYPHAEYVMDDLTSPEEHVTYVGQGAASLSTPDVPSFAEMVQHVFDRLNWDGEKFKAYRCRIAYPMMPSTVEIRIDLPSA